MTTIRLYGVALDASVVAGMREAADAAERERPGWQEMVAALPASCRPAARRPRWPSDTGGEPLPAGDPACVAGRLRMTADFIDRRRRGVPFGGEDPVTGFPGWAKMREQLPARRGLRGRRRDGRS